MTTEAQCPVTGSARKPSLTGGTTNANWWRTC